MTIIILGAGGQLGQSLRQRFPLALALTRADADIGDFSRINALFAHHKPTIILNSSAYTAVDKAEDEYAKADLVNHLAVSHLQALAQQYGAFLVHYSTDYVFDGQKSSPYQEGDKTNPLSVYGRTKRAGELALWQSQYPCLIVRTSWVYSRHGANFPRTIIRLLRERDSLTVVQDQIGTPTSTDLLADITVELVQKIANIKEPTIMHLQPRGLTNWYEMAQLILARARVHAYPLKSNSINITPILTKDYQYKAPRPLNSRLDCSLLEQFLGRELPDWRGEFVEIIDSLLQ